SSGLEENCSAAPSWLRSARRFVSPLHRQLGPSRSCAAPQNLATIAQFQFCMLRSGAETTMRRTFLVLALGGLLLSGTAWSQECSLSIEGNDQIQFSKQELQRSYGHAKARRPTRSERHGAQLGAHCHGRLPSSRRCRTSCRSSELCSSR